MRYDPEEINEKNKAKAMADFYKAITLIEDYNEAKAFFGGLLSVKEIIMLSRRIQIALMLLTGCTYQEITNSLKVGVTTIANVQKWMSKKENSVKNYIERLKKIEQNSFKGKIDPFSAEAIKKRYAAYYWPQRLSGEISDKIDKRETLKTKFNSIKKAK